jgi:hypothetical protein
MERRASPPGCPTAAKRLDRGLILKALGEKAVSMKLALRLSILLSGIVSAVALAELLHVLAGLFLAGPFDQVFNHTEYRDMEHLFHVWTAYFLTAAAITIWLWGTYRKQYGKLWKSK